MRQLLSDVCTEVMRLAAQQGNTNPTIVKKRQVFKILTEDEFLGMRTTADLGPGLLDSFLAAGGWTNPNTQAGMLSCLRGILNDCEGLGHVPPGYVVSLRFDTYAKPAPPGPIGATLSIEDVSRVWQFLNERAVNWQGARLLTLFALTVHTGLDRNEILFLRWEDVDFESGTILVRKRTTHTSRYCRPPALPLPDDVREVLARWKALNSTEWVLPGIRGTSPWSSGSVGYKPLDQLQAAAKECGVAGLDFKALARYHRTYARPVTPMAETTGLPVALAGPNGRPVVLGQEVEALTITQHSVVEALIAAYPGGLTLSEIKEISGDARSAMDRLATKRPDSWGRIYATPGVRGGGLYRLKRPEDECAQTPHNLPSDDQEPSR